MMHFEIPFKNVIGSHNIWNGIVANGKMQISSQKVIMINRIQEENLDYLR